MRGAAWAVLAMACEGPEGPAPGSESPAPAPVPVPVPVPESTTATGCAAPGAVCTVLGMPGVALLTGTEGEATEFGLHVPTGTAIGSGGEIYVADESNH